MPFPVRHKFNAIRTIQDGITFSSKKEAARYRDHKLAQQAGVLVFFLRQVPFYLPGGVRYVVDFVLFYANGEVVFEDVKGFKTPEYKTKKRLVEALYPITIREV